MIENKFVEIRKNKLDALERLKKVIREKFLELDESGNPNFVEIKNTFQNKFNDNFERWYGNIALGTSLLLQIDSGNKIEGKNNLVKINWFLENLGFDGGVENIILKDDFQIIME